MMSVGDLDFDALHGGAVMLDKVDCVAVKVVGERCEVARDSGAA